MTTYRVTYEHVENIYCVNIANAESVQDIENYYSKYRIIDIKEASEYDIREAKRRGMPIVDIEPAEKEEQGLKQDHTKILDFIKENSSLTMSPALVNKIFENAFQLTAYERNGSISETDLYFYLASESEDLSIDAYNEWTVENHDPDSYIYSMTEFNDVMSAFEPERIADMCYYGDYSPTAEYFTFDGYGNIKSIHEYDDTPYDPEELKEYFIENNRLEYFTEYDRETIETAMEYKDIIIETALYMVSLGY